MKTALYLDHRQPESVRVADLVGRLTLDEKIGLMYFIAPAIPRLGIPSYDHGNEALHGVVRPGPATVFPQAIGLAATWNPPLIQRMADAVSDEARAKHHALDASRGLNVAGLLTFWSPVVNMVRDPRWGRTQETYGEDPHLTSRMGVAFVRGLQGAHPRYLKAVSTPKHFAGNSEEHNRFECPVDADERYWHEYELPGFRACIREAHAQSVMSAYNAISGVPCSGNHWLLTQVLRGMWGFDGYVVSDCGAISNMVDRHQYVPGPEEAAAAAVNAGLDLEGGWFCKYPDLFREYLAKAVQKGLVSIEAVDRAVSRVLAGRMRLGMFDPPERIPYSRLKASVIGCAKHQTLAREIARQSMVLLKNAPCGTVPLLPLDPSRLRRIAVVGSNAALCQFGNYAPASSPNAEVSPLEGIRNRLGASCEVVHVPWLSSHIGPVPSDRLIAPAEITGGNGLLGRYYRNERLAGEPFATRLDRRINLDGGNIEPDPLATGIQGLAVRWTGALRPPATGTYTLYTTTTGGVRIILDGRIILDAWDCPELKQEPCQVELLVGRDYPLVIEYRRGEQEPYCNLEWQTPASWDEWTDAVREADAVVAVLGLGLHVENEGCDRMSLELPAEQERFIRRILKLNPRTVVVLKSGSPLAINWIARNVPAVLMAWYPGEQGGNAIADVLFGDFNPAGRLPVTFYRSDKQLRPFNEYDITRGRTYMYLRGKPLYAFGHGLSYTRFEYGAISLSANEAGVGDRVTVAVEVRNAGDRDGDEVVQLYVRDLNSVVAQPIRQLKAFQRVYLKHGEKRRVELTVAVKDLAFWDVRCKSFLVEAGDFDLQVGAASDDIRVRARLRVPVGGIVDL